MDKLILEQTMVQALEDAANSNIPDKGYRFIQGTQEEFISFEMLWYKARSYASYFQQQGIQPGDYVSMILPTCPEFAYCFYGLMACGAIPTALASPTFEDQKEGFNRLDKIGELLEIKHIVMNKTEFDLIGKYLKNYEPMLVEKIPDDQTPIENVHKASPEDTVLVQATSGSTGLPKAVPLTNRNLAANIQQIADRVNITSDDIIITWLPLYHDFGLIGNFLSTVYFKYNSVLQSPYEFLKRPITWLRAIEKYKATITVSPNFALSYAVARINEEDRNSLDISSLKVAIVGSEPVNMKTLRSFADYFKTSGFNLNTFAIGYGGSEAGLLATMRPWGEALSSDIVSRSNLSDNGEITEPKYPNDSLEIADCGSPVTNFEIEIRDTKGNKTKDCQVGHIWWKSPSLTSGYIGSEEINKREFVDDWFNSGDLGYLKNDHLFVTGRHKELVIIRGQNYIPTDFEVIATQIEGVKEGRVVAFGDVDDETGSEELILVCGIDITAGHDQATLAASIKSLVAEKTGIAPYKIQFIPHNMMPRTTGGKLQRLKVKKLYISMKQQ
jgi:acyl-CoA synthetase (AMP-forming)/AMP-acid ligase II